ncbi:MAG: glycoside hydrolase family 27 protein [Clostridia bacterium]|nr:glycoside hydrolase family 27 protein [Clostridia bacterium]
MANRRKTPIMGWASWNCFGTNISEEKIRSQIDALIESGLESCGYEYINIDDGFFGGRDGDGNLQTHKLRFPNGIKVIADYAHEKGLKAGIYSEGGRDTCGFYYNNEGENGEGVGLYGYEEQDLRLYLETYGFDFIKVDWCGGLRLGLDRQEQYSKIGAIIDEIRERTGRPIVYNVCCWDFPGEWVTEVADSWRTGADIAPTFESVMYEIDKIRSLAEYCGPGHVNDPDMMQLGNGMSEEEEKTHFAMWCMMSAPLIIGCDLTKIRESTLNILKNKELIALDQDSACLQARLIETMDNGVEVWCKELGDGNTGRKALAFLNRSSEPALAAYSLAEAGIIPENIKVRDLWAHKDIQCDGRISVEIPPHATAVFTVESTLRI